jgi:hypothetical protein
MENYSKLLKLGKKCFELIGKIKIGKRLLQKERAFPAMLVKIAENLNYLNDLIHQL